VWDGGNWFLGRRVWVEIWTDRWVGVISMRSFFSGTPGRWWARWVGFYWLENLGMADGVGSGQR
jgi:hypothetical protein